MLCYTFCDVTHWKCNTLREGTVSQLIGDIGKKIIQQQTRFGDIFWGQSFSEFFDIISSFSQRNFCPQEMPLRNIPDFFLGTVLGNSTWRKILSQRNFPEKIWDKTHWQPSNDRLDHPWTTYKQDWQMMVTMAAIWESISLVLLFQHIQEDVQTT